MTDKQPSLDVKGLNIEPDTFGEVTWAMLKEYTDTVSADTLSTKLDGKRQLVRAVVGSVIESILVLAANKLQLDLIDMLGTLERTKSNVLRQVEAQQNRQLYQRAKASVEADAKKKEEVVKDVVGTITPGA